MVVRTNRNPLTPGIRVGSQLALVASLYTPIRSNLASWICTGHIVWVSLTMKNAIDSTSDKCHVPAEAADTVLASNIELMFLKRKIFDDPNAVTKAEFDAWLSTWDAHLCKHTHYFSL